MSEKRKGFYKFVCPQENDVYEYQYKVHEEEDIRDKMECLEILKESEGSSSSSSSVLGEKRFIEMLNLERKTLLAIECFVGTLKEWLVMHKGEDVFCGLQLAAIGENRPNEAFRRIIEGMFKAVCLLHMQGRFHGGLRHPENYSLSPERGSIGHGQPPFSVSVTLTTAKGNFNKMCLTSKEKEKMIKKDRDDLRYLVFRRMLKDKSLPSDLEHLKVNMLVMSSNPLSSIEDAQITIGAEILYTHPGLSSWGTRVQFYNNIFGSYDVVTGDKSKAITGDLNAMSSTMGWMTKVQSVPELKEVLDYRLAKYKDDGASLLRFAKAVHLHGTCDTPAKQLQNEKRLRDCFPLLMVESSFIFARYNTLQ